MAAATFMAVSGTIPEFFTNLISTFVTDSDMGLGAIIGSLFFNTLGVAACAGLATRVPVKLPWYPIIRDCSIFSINVAILVALSWDGRIEWYEGMILTICAVLYWILLFQNDKVESTKRKLNSFSTKFFFWLSLSDEEICILLPG